MQGGALIDCIYEAAIRPEAWGEVVNGISDLFEGSPVALGFMLSGEAAAVPRYSTGLEASRLPQYTEYLQKDLGWSARHLRRCAERFVDLAEIFEPIELEETDLYRQWLKPQGLAPIWPVVHTICNREGEPIGTLSVFRAAGREAFDDEERAAADEYVHHLRRAVDVHATLYSVRRARLALAEVMDRLPMGMLLLDERRRPVLLNQSAERIVAGEDGLRLDPGGPGADDARENAQLQTLIADALDAGRGHALERRGFLSVSRPSGRRSLSLMVTSLRGGARDVRPGEAAVALFVSDPEVERIRGAKALAELYGLTQSEAELLQLLSTGMSLEEAAAARGISLNTARSHVKHVFAKTGVSRQGELVRLILIGVGAIREQ